MALLSDVGLPGSWEGRKLRRLPSAAVPDFEDGVGVVRLSEISTNTAGSSRSAGPISFVTRVSLSHCFVDSFGGFGLSLRFTILSSDILTLRCGLAAGTDAGGGDDEGICDDDAATRGRLLDEMLVALLGDRIHSYVKPAAIAPKMGPHQYTCTGTTHTWTGENKIGVRANNSVKLSVL